MTIQRILLHNHSTWSDGQLSLNAVVRLGERLGASAVIMSDHDYYFTASKWDDYVDACRKASTPRCALIPGIEYSSANDAVHIITVGTPLFHGARRDLVETVTAVRGQGGAALLAHPRRRDCLRHITGELLDLIDGIEIWNRKVDGLMPVQAYFKMAQERGLATTVGMDLHTWRQIFPMWNEIEAEAVPGSLDGKSVAAAIHKREIAPSCIVGRVASGLDASFSLAISALGAAEKSRRLLRNMRDAFRPG